MEWVTLNLAMLDGIDGGNRATVLMQRPDIVFALQPRLAWNCLNDPAWREPPPRVALLQNTISGGMVMDHIVSQIGAGTPQGERYLIKQLKAYKSGERENAIMQGQAANLSEQDMQDLAAFFRIEGVLAMRYYPQGVYRPGLHWGHADGFHPWGMSARCGSFILPDDVEEDAEGWTGYFIEAIDDRPSIWHLERLLRDGFEELRESGLPSANPSNVDGELALAWMVGMRVAERVWLEITGRPLTTPFFFPRNRYQRDLLVHLPQIIRHKFVGLVANPRLRVVAVRLKQS